MNPQSLARFERFSFAFGLLARLGLLQVFANSPWSKYPMVDAFTYWEQAGQLLAGKEPFAEGYYQPPAYPVLLSYVGMVTGGMQLGVVRLVQVGLGALTTALLIRLGRRLGDPLGAPWAGALAGLIYTFYAPVVMFELDILTPAWTSAALVGALSLLTEAAGRWRLLAGGLLLGLAVALHPTYLLGALVLIGFTLARQAAKGPAAGALLLGLALPVLPTTVENLRRFDTVELVSHNAGINFFLGNNTRWRDTSFLRPGLPFRQLALAAEPDRRDVAARNAYWKERAAAEIAANPDAWAGALLTKALWSVSDVEIPRNEDFRCRMQPGEVFWIFSVFPFRYGVVLPFAVIGAAALLRRREGALVGLWGALHLPLILFIVADRYRLATWPVMALLAPLGLASLRAAWAARQTAGLPRWLLIGAPALLLPFLPIDRRTAMDPSLCAYQKGDLLYMEKKFSAAEEAYGQVLATRPDDMSAHYWLANLAALRKDWRVAADHMAVVLAQFPDYFPGLKSMGEWSDRLGDLDGAIAYTQRAYAVPGDRTATGRRLLRLLKKAGRTAEAEALLASNPRLGSTGAEEE